MDECQLDVPGAEARESPTVSASKDRFCRVMTVLVNSSAPAAITFLMPATLWSKLPGTARQSQSCISAVGPCKLTANSVGPRFHQLSDLALVGQHAAVGLDLNVLVAADSGAVHQ